MQNHKVTLIPGDGIGPEITEAVLSIFSAANVPIVWDTEIAGMIALEQKGSLIPDSLLISISKNRVALKGPLTTPVGKGFKSVNVQLRQKFNLFSNVRPCKNTPGVETRFSNVDLVIFRENTEGMYAGLEYYDDRLEISDTIARVSKEGCYRIIEAALEYAEKHGRKKVTLVHKANILKNSGSLLLEAGKDLIKSYPSIELDDKIIDNMCMQLVTRPEQFDVIATTNLFGDILSDLCAGLVGGLGVVAGANLGEDCAIFEAVHGSAPDIAGKGIANPTAMLQSGIMMLRHLSLNQEADRIENALFKTLAVKEKCTGDLGGKANTKEFTQHVISNL